MHLHRHDNPGRALCGATGETRAASTYCRDQRACATCVAAWVRLLDAIDACDACSVEALCPDHEPNSVCHACSHGIDCAEHPSPPPAEAIQHTAPGRTTPDMTPAECAIAAGAWCAADVHPQVDAFDPEPARRVFHERPAAVAYARRRSAAGKPCDVYGPAGELVYTRAMDLNVQRAQMGLFS